MKTRSKINFGFWFQWILLNAVGWAMGMTIRQFLFGITGFATNQVMIGVVVGTAVGIAQIFGFTQAGYRAGWWVLASTVGWAVGWGTGWEMGWALLGSQGFKGAYGTIGVMSGVIGGVIQWVTLRQQVYQAGWWVLASASGWAVGLAVGINVGGPFGWAVAGAMSGAITGFVLVWLLRHPVSGA